jgi:hypothetical protein
MTTFVDNERIEKSDETADDDDIYIMYAMRYTIKKLSELGR